MRHVIFMAWRYLGFYWGKTAVLVASISLILFVPAGLHVLVEQGAEVLTARAEATPLLIGAKGLHLQVARARLSYRNLVGTSGGKTFANRALLRCAEGEVPARGGRLSAGWF